MRLHIVAAATLAAALVACSSNTSGAAQTQADEITNAVYANNVATVQSKLAPALQKDITRTSVAVLSDEMHKLGSFKGLTLLAADATKSEFTYRAQFDTGTMNVTIRLAPDGKAAAYRATQV